MQKVWLNMSIFAMRLTILAGLRYRNIESQVWGQEHVRNVSEATLGLSPLDPADLVLQHEAPAVSSMLLTTRPLDSLY